MAFAFQLAGGKLHNMHDLSPKNVECPYCGEFIEVLIDCSVAQQDYIEDCQVCCKPIIFNVEVDSEGNLSVSVRDENEAY